MADSGSGSNAVSDYSANYLIVSSNRGSLWDLLRYTFWDDALSGSKFLQGPTETLKNGFSGDKDRRWVITVSVLARKLIAFFRKPLKWTGFLVDFLLNLLFLNNGLFGLISNLVHGRVVIPQRDSETFLSIMGHLDGRMNLHHRNYMGDYVSGDSNSNSNSRIRVELGDQSLVDLCMMSSKLVYENDKVVCNVVHHNWKMHFVDFFNCWNEYHKEMDTQVFIICDKPRDANLILISFRGTEPFDADDWITDFDYSWYDIPNVGKVHIGFLEALGLGSRADIANLQNHLEAKRRLHTDPLSSENGRLIPPGMGERSGYYVVRRKLKKLLEEHENARFVVTGHSLGGALAVLFPTVLILHEEKELMERLLGVYTFGQPRIGNERLGKFVESHLGNPTQRYYRVVYCNDLVPRLPYDDKTFLYKHFGVCFYYDSFYMEKVVVSEPNPNFFGMSHLIPQYVNAGWELIRGFAMGFMYGPEYREGWFTFLQRLVGLVLPGVSDHCPTDYVNSVRLGNAHKLQMFAI